MGGSCHVWIPEHHGHLIQAIAWHCRWPSLAWRSNLIGSKHASSIRQDNGLISQSKDFLEQTQRENLKNFPKFSTKRRYFEFSIQFFPKG
jgi:hypothetical protein